MPERRILVVESSKILGPVIEDYFSKVNPRYVVLPARSIPAALKVIRNFPIDLIVSDHDGSPKFDGLDLLRKIKEFDLVLKVIICAERHRENDRIESLLLGCANFIIKPFPYEKLCELIHNMLLPQQGFTGRLVGIRLEDVIQMFCYRRDSTLLTVFSGNMKGSIYIHDGGIIHAECDSMSGVEAFYEILGWDQGEFLSQIVLTVPEQTLFVDWQSLLMEGMRQKDEIRHALGPVVSVEAGLDAKNGNRLDEATFEGSSSAKKIMIVDDSRFIRKIVQEILQADPDLLVAGFAANGQEALAKIEEMKPDLILLDWDMPVMKGSTTLMHIMIKSPCPVVILSGFVGGVGANPFDLLCLGGVDFLRKPQSNWRMDGRADDLVRRIKEACGIKFERIRRLKIPRLVKESEKPVENSPASFLSVFVSFIGGCNDLIRIIPALPDNLSSVIVVLHDMQKEAISAFIDYLNRRSRIHVCPLENGTQLFNGICYLHPATVPLQLTNLDNKLFVTVSTDIVDQRAVDHFLKSASQIMRDRLLTVLLSGGPGRAIEGLSAVKRSNGITMVQDPTSCVDPRMAEGALQEGIVDHKLAAGNIVESLLKVLRHMT